MCAYKIYIDDCDHKRITLIILIEVYNFSLAIFRFIKKKRIIHLKKLLFFKLII